MQRMLAVTLASLAACGGPLPAATRYQASGGQIPASPAGFPASTPTYRIDAPAAANIPLDTYGITTNGVTWYLEWQSADAAHVYSGDIYCPSGCSFSYVALRNMRPENSYRSVSAEHLHFDAPTAAGLHQHLEFDSSLQPVTFDLRFDGQPAVDPFTVFASDNQLATVASMPFNLVSTNVAPGMLRTRNP